MAKPSVVSTPGPTARATPVVQKAAVRTTPAARPTPATAARPTPPPPPPPPPAKEPEKKLYRAKFNFDGQEGEMSLVKDDEVEVLEESDNGWWLIKKDGEEGWAPYNYLELIPPKAAPAPPPPPARPRPTPSAPITANASAKPVSVFPGMASNGTTPSWKKPAATNNSTPDSSRPPSSVARVPPPVAAKPKPPVVAPKPGGKPAVSATSRPTPSAGRGGGGGGGAGPGQLDLAAAVSLAST